ncbi:MAG: sigma-70 family RNA polymerase sigma factor [Chloroflexi bacterium]|nr:sigma-70 family RNA polymerase sigma factor [Chloroflexota bacterium]
MNKSKQEIAIQQSNKDDPEEKMVADAKQNPQAFAVIYDRYVNQIYRYLLSHVGNSTEAQDMTSQVFLSALDRFSSYQHKGHFAAWLFTIARHKWMDYFRQDHRELPLEAVANLPSKEDPHLDTLNREEILMIRRAVFELPEEDQELIRLRFVARLNFAEIALILGCKEEAAKKRVYRLLARLENEMEVRNG